MSRRQWVLSGLGVLLVLCMVLAALWLARAKIAAQFARQYFAQHGVASSVEVSALGLSGVSGRFALGPARAPELAAARIELIFDPLRWKPYLVEVRLVDPVVRARLGADGKVTLPALQQWLDSLAAQPGKSAYVSEDLVIGLHGLKALLATPAGRVEIDGDARLVRMMPVSAALSLKPAELHMGGTTLRLRGAALGLARQGDTYEVTAQLRGDLQSGALAASGVTARLEVSRLGYGSAITAQGISTEITADSLRLGGETAGMVKADLAAPQICFAGGVAEVSQLAGKVSATGLGGLFPAADLSAQIAAMQIRASAAGVEGQGDVNLAMTAPLPPAIAKTIRGLPLLAMDAPLRKAVTANLGPFAVAADAHLAYRDKRMEARLNRPLTVKAPQGAALTVSDMELTWERGLRGRFNALLAGGGLPPVALSAPQLTLDGRGLRAGISARAKLDFALLRGAEIALSGSLAGEGGAVSFTLADCTPFALAALGPLAERIKAKICPSGQPLFRLDASGWRANAEAREVSAFLPLGNADLKNGAARLVFDGKAGPRGTVTVSAATISDAARALRFNPLSGEGIVTLADSVWQGRLNVHDLARHPLGNASFRHAMETGIGSAHLTAALVFAEGGLQPESLSPMLAKLRNVKGSADFAGDLGWTAAGLSSQQGSLRLLADFMTPLGRAHAVNSTMALTSLLPPRTASGQPLSIAAIDWTVPVEDISLLYSFASDAVQVQNLKAHLAGGYVALTPFGLDASAPGAVSSTATIAGLSLAPLLNASNLGDRAMIEGTFTGAIPFVMGPEGLRISNGHLKADGPGRLSLKQSLWGDNAAANAVQGFAYQALENLAFESMTADINSIDGGRLQVVFHVKGRSDPPMSQTADVPLNEIIDGSALYKTIPLPSGTPIDLTLDTSLNFDQLLKSYVEAWSISRAPGAPP